MCFAVHNYIFLTEKIEVEPKKVVTQVIKRISHDRGAMVNDFYSTRCMFSIPSPRLAIGDRKHTMCWIKSFAIEMKNLIFIPLIPICINNLNNSSVGICNVKFV